MTTERWTPFGPATMPGLPSSEGGVWMNSRYTVVVRDIEHVAGGPPITHLSIKRNDKEALHDWRDLQRIKNELCGPEREAVEIYPAESRLVDTANQYHLWVMPEGVVLPFGFHDGRLVGEDPGPSGAKQRPWDDDSRPDDLITAENLDQRAQEYLRGLVEKAKKLDPNYDPNRED